MPSENVKSNSKPNAPVDPLNAILCRRVTELRLTPSASLPSAHHYEGTKELLTVTSGSACIRSGDTSYNLAEGDSAYYRADVKQTIENIGTQERVCYLVVTGQS